MERVAHVLACSYLVRCQRGGFAAVPALPAKPSIAVLPFVNLSGDPEQDYLADGVVEDTIAALSQYRWLFVVARNSSFTYKVRAVDIKLIVNVRWK